MTTFLSDGANLAAVGGALVVTLMFAWRVLRRLGRIVRLLEQSSRDHSTLRRHDRRLRVIERLLGIPTPTREETP